MSVTRRERHVGLGLLVGLALGVFYSLIVIAIALVSAGSIKEQYGFSILVLIVTYLYGGMSGGAIVGWLWPWTTSRLGALIVGVIGAAPLGLGAAVALADANNYTDALIAGAIVSTILGAWAGLFFLAPSRPDDSAMG